jgi:hypothetical protein
MLTAGLTFFDFMVADSVFHIGSVRRRHAMYHDMISNLDEIAFIHNVTLCCMTRGHVSIARVVVEDVLRRLNKVLPRCFFFRLFRLIRVEQMLSS